VKRIKAEDDHPSPVREPLSSITNNISQDAISHHVRCSI